MDELDHKIIQLLAENARMPVKDIAQRVSLTSPAVSSRIHRLEQEGIIGGYTVVLRHPDAPARVEALISVLVDAATRASFLSMIEQESQVLQCFRVTGSYNFIIKVSCTDIDALEHLLTKMQRWLHQHPDYSEHPAGPQSDIGGITRLCYASVKTAACWCRMTPTAAPSAAHRCPRPPAQRRSRPCPAAV